MTAHYKLVRNPKPIAENSDKSQPLHPRFVALGTLRQEEFIEAAKERSSFSSADIKGVLQLCQDVAVDYLRQGYNVELEGIGTLSVALKSRPEMEKEKIRSASIRFKDVRFRSSKALRDALKDMKLMRDPEKVSDPSSLTAKECERLLFEYLSTHPFILRKEYMQLCQCSKTKALQDLRKYVIEEKLSTKKVGTSFLYMKV